MRSSDRVSVAFKSQGSTPEHKARQGNQGARYDTLNILPITLESARLQFTMTQCPTQRLHNDPSDQSSTAWATAAMSTSHHALQECTEANLHHLPHTLPACTRRLLSSCFRIHLLMPLLLLAMALLCGRAWLWVPSTADATSSPGAPCQP